MSVGRINDAFVLAAAAMIAAHAQSMSAFVGGEVGCETQRHANANARVNGQSICVDHFAHNAGPDVVMNEAKRRLVQQL